MSSDAPAKEVVSKPSSPGPNSPKKMKAAADKILFDALVGIGFNLNIWNMDPMHVRWLLEGLTAALGAIALWSWSHFGLYRWTFVYFDVTLFAVLAYWYNSVECGGGKHLFSPDWRDSFVKTKATKTNYVVTIAVGYEEVITASLPFSSFKYDEDNEVDLKWLAVELNEQFPMYKFRPKDFVKALREKAMRK